MTPEEAAEEILGGRAYATCVHCAGSGVNDKPVRPGLIAMHNYCESCNGSGQWLRGDYVTACHIVGKDPPPKPWGRLTRDGLFRPMRKEDFDSFFRQMMDTPFRKEYMGVWAEETEQEVNHTLDSMHYALSHHPSNKRP